MGCSSSTAVLTVDADTAQAPCGDRRRSSTTKGLPTAKVVPLEWRVEVQKRQGDVLGAGLGNTDKGAVILSIQKNGLLDLWNMSQEHQPLRPGYIITEVNGTMGYWDIIEELQRPGVLDMKITAEPPLFAGPNWFQEITEMGKTLEAKGVEAKGDRSSFMLRLQPQEPGRENGFSSLPTVRAGDCGVDQCAICIDDVAPDESLVQLPCNHAFHALCAARWLTQVGRHSQGKRQCCPLCCQKVVCSPEGGIEFSRRAD
jgi:hypothetical protein